VVDHLQALQAVGLGMDRGDVHLVLGAEVNGFTQHLAQLIPQHGLVLGGFGEVDWLFWTAPIVTV
jgi:hypothetical protein